MWRETPGETPGLRESVRRGQGRREVEAEAEEDGVLAVSSRSEHVAVAPDPRGFAVHREARGLGVFLGAFVALGAVFSSVTPVRIVEVDRGPAEFFAV